ncbi:hypothetical protein Q2T83_01510 [Fervidibacter sacchari]|uniref:Uncharacterized protein n=1 Tax=Candidatus Fervidibacter sacchari TaxID=1448929 RepID=A0ABT2ET40_9BACT|nr:hypothetical protein [Candidatus Fervidibacter sacchari]MCS3921138.1 hypothetical protein [Candidatus Fervidibacter sacchari]WKU16514.1 hypothetical protein Q2T83_01510 [Candidatus Fervidibacter sacchari]
MRHVQSVLRKSVMYEARCVISSLLSSFHRLAASPFLIPCPLKQL